MLLGFVSRMNRFMNVFVLETKGNCTLTITVKSMLSPSSGPGREYAHSN